MGYPVNQKVLPENKKSPPIGDKKSGSTWAPISFCPIPFQEQLGYPTDNQSHQVLQAALVLL